VVGRDVRTRLGRQHGEGFAKPRVVADQARDAQQPTARRCEQPPVLALLLRVRRRRKFVEAVGDDQAAAGGKFAAVGTEIIDRLAALGGPAPAPDDQVERVARRPNDWCEFGDPDVARLKVRNALRESQIDLLLAEQARDLVG